MSLISSRAHGSSPTLFLTTRWSVVLAAQGGKAGHGEASAALESLCRIYWQPLYIYARRRGHAPQDAEDLTQGFFARLLGKDWLAPVQQEKGRFRQFLLMAFKRFLANEYDHAQRLKRGGSGQPVPIDTVLGEKLYLEQTSPSASADESYDRRWALSLLDSTLARLREEFTSTSREREFTVLKPQLTAPRGQIDYAALAVALQATEGAARVAVHRLRKRFREIFRDEIAQTLGSADELDDELRHLIGVLAQQG